jgi:multisubunit Na+/H+ antiporter MnhC subunit
MISQAAAIPCGMGIGPMFSNVIASAGAEAAPMMSSPAVLFTLFGIGVVLTVIAGLYLMLVTRNLIRSLIGLEVMTKGITLLIIVAGSATGQQALAQSLAITQIVIEVAVLVVAVGLVLSVFKHTKSIEASKLRNVKG